MSNLWESEDTELAREIVRLTRGETVRGAAKQIGISPGTLNRWRGLLRQGQRIEMEEVSKAAVIRFLEARTQRDDAPIDVSLIQFAIRKFERQMQEGLAELQAMIPQQPQPGTPPRKRRRRGNGGR